MVVGILSAEGWEDPQGQSMKVILDCMSWRSRKRVQFEAQGCCFEFRIGLMQETARVDTEAFYYEGST